MQRLFGQWGRLRPVTRAVLLGALLVIAIAGPAVPLPAPLDWLRWPAYAINVVMIAAVGQEALAMRRTVGDFQAGIELASRFGGMKLEATSAQVVVERIGDYTTTRALAKSIGVAIGCVLLLAVLVASLFYGLAARSQVYDPIGIATNGYPAFLAYVADYASLRGFFGFLDLFERATLHDAFGWAHVFPRQLPKSLDAFALGAALAALRLYAQVVAVGMLFIIVRILKLRRQYRYLFVPEQRTAAIKA
jgi:hypothetical protein